jgi:hypothetical protein
MKRQFRNANIGLAFGLTTLAIGFAVFHDSEAAMELLAMGAFALAMGVFVLLVWRDERTRRQRKGSRP